MERPGLDPFDIERLESPLQLTGGLVGEGDGEDLRRAELAATNLARDAMRDRGGLACPRSGQDGDRTTEREGGFTLGIVQSGENALEVEHLSDPSIGPRTTDQMRIFDLSAPTARVASYCCACRNRVLTAS